MSKTISADEWTEVVSERHDSTVYTLEVSGEDVYAAKTSGAPPMEPEKGITLRSNESHFTPLDQSDALFLRSTSRISASVRVVPGMKAESSGRASVNADLVGTPSVDPSDRTGRNNGKIRIMDDSEALITDTNPFPTGVRAWNAGTLPVQEDTPLDVSAATVSQTTDSTDAGPYTDRVNTAGSNATISPGRHGQPVTIVADTSGTATLTVEVSVDGGTTWDAYTVSIGGAEGVKEEVSGFGDVRASVDQNLNALSISAKGL